MFYAFKHIALAIIADDQDHPGLTKYTKLNDVLS